MRRNPSALHLFLTLLLLVGLLFGAVGQTLVRALGENFNIDWENSAVPFTQSFKRQDPTTSPTNADTLTFRVTFSGAVSGVDATDFMVHDNTPAPTTNAPGLTVTRVSNSIYDVKIYGGDLDLFDGIVGLDFSGSADIKDGSGVTSIPISEPPINETYLVDNTNPIVTIEQKAGQSDPALSQPVEFKVVFGEEIAPSTFTASDITQGGTAPSPVWSIVDSGDHMNFALSVVASGNGTINPFITAGRVNDLAGNGNDPFIKGCDNQVPDNCVTLADVTPPTVTITQAATQADPATRQPIIFTIEFSEVINTDTFTTEDITQSGTAHISNWSITDTGDHKTFKLIAWASENGLIMPTIVVNATSITKGRLRENPQASRWGFI